MTRQLAATAILLISCSQDPAYRDQVRDETSVNKPDDDLTDSARRHDHSDDSSRPPPIVPAPANNDDLGVAEPGVQPLPGSEPGNAPTPTPTPTVGPTVPTTIRVTERFTQSGELLLDILWVIDNSGSMKPYQTQLRASFKDFVERIATRAIDFQIGVTSTSVCQAVVPERLDERRCPEETPGEPSLQGALAGDAGRRVLKHDAPDLIARFQRYANLGTKGSSFEHGLTATKLAVERAARGESEGFLREGAFLAVIFVSDEEDDGVGLSRPNEQGKNYWELGKTRYRFTADDLVASLRLTHSDGRFGLYSIVNKPHAATTDCQESQGNTPEQGKEYIRASTLTGGGAADICDPAWSSMLASLGDTIVTRLDSFRLAHIPVPTTLSVTVNNVAVGGWTYRSTDNLLVFEKESVPPPSAAVAITYDMVEPAL